MTGELVKLQARILAAFLALLNTSYTWRRLTVILYFVEFLDSNMLVYEKFPLQYFWKNLKQTLLQPVSNRANLSVQGHSRHERQ